MPGEIDDLIAPFSFKGVAGQGPAGNHLEDPSEWGIRTTEMDAYQLEYLQWHQTYHKNVRDPRCTICTAEANFQAQREPHEKNHRALRQYDPQCRFCQDDRFFGRM